MKISPMGTELFHPNGQKDVTKLIVGFTILRMCLKQKEKRRKRNSWVRGERRSTARDGRDLHFIRIYCPRKRGMGTKKKSRKHMGDGFFLRQCGTWKLEDFSTAELSG